MYATPQDFRDLQARTAALIEQLQEQRHMETNPYCLDLTDDKLQVANQIMPKLRPAPFEESDNGNDMLYFYSELFDLMDQPDGINGCWHWCGDTISGLNWHGIGLIDVDVRPLLYNLLIADVHPFTHLICRHEAASGQQYICTNPWHLDFQPGARHKEQHYAYA